MEVLYFTATVKHDHGSKNIRTAASDPEHAAQIIMKAEGCPRSAIVRIKESMSKKEQYQVRKFINAPCNGHGSKALKALMSLPDGMRGRVIRHLERKHGIKFI